MVRNHRTHEEYTGFFLSVSNEENVKHGYGITKFPDGRIFEGSYEKGRMVEGKMTYPVVSSTASAAALVAAAFQSDHRRESLSSSGATYVGKFDEDGLKCGKGIYTTAAATFLGQFHRDEQHGPGILIYHDGTDDAHMNHSRRFIGHWKHGSRNGFGREILTDGTVERDGHWENGLFTGAAKVLRGRVAFYTGAVAWPRCRKGERGTHIARKKEYTNGKMRGGNPSSHPVDWSRT